LQIIPRDAKAVTLWASPEEAFVDVASEIRKMVSEPVPSPSQASAEQSEADRSSLSADLVREQLRTYAHLYERTRQRMRASHERTQRLEQIFAKMLGLATASYPLLDELAGSPSPGERLAAIAILQMFASERFLPFLVKLVGEEKPFVGYHAIRALHFAVGALDPRAHPQLLEAIHNAQKALDSSGVGSTTDRQKALRDAEQELRATMESLAAPERRE
jgi:hypothetical protein